MNNSRIKDYLDNLLSGYQQTPDLLEQKEELMIHLTERVQDHMTKGLTYDQAFEATIKDMGDVNELIAGMAPQKQTSAYPLDRDNYNDMQDRWSKKNVHLPKRVWLPLASLSPFIYIILGVAFGWWAWAWVIIPMLGVLSTGNWKVMLVGITPFIYFLLGWFFGWWAWGWLIIPMAGVIFTCHE